MRDRINDARSSLGAPKITQKSQDRPKEAPRGSKKASGPAKMTILIAKFDVAKIIEKHKENERFWPPQPAQDRPKPGQDDPRWVQDRPKTSQDHSKTTPRSPQDRLRFPQDRLRPPKTAPRPPKTIQSPLKTSPRPPREVPRSAQEASRPCQKAPRQLQKGPKHRPYREAARLGACLIPSNSSN